MSGPVARSSPPGGALARYGAGEVVIVGAGLAGLFTALKLAPLPVTVVAAESLGQGTSSGWAQGGIAAAVAEGDSPQAHAADTIRAGAGIVEEKMARLLADEARARIEDLLRYGVPFDRDLEGRLKLSREAAHGARRIIRVKGDMAGKEIMAAVTAAARESPSIRIVEGYIAQDLAVEDGCVAGVCIRPTAAGDASPPLRLPARAVVLASGGIGQLYAVTTNPAHARGDGLAMAARAGAAIADAEFVQFHPTALDIGRDPAPLATEALRGEGATLINRDGRRFMAGVHRDAELAPRDIVARAVHREIQAGRGAFLDCRTAIGARFAEAFPTIHAVCAAAGIDPARDPLPIAPAAHYHMGGVLTDADGRTTLDGLWACGEAASTGAHGANRLASNSLLETVVFGARVAADLAALLASEPVGRRTVVASAPDRPAAKVDDGGRTMQLRKLMAADVGVNRDRDGLAAAIRRLSEIERDPETPREVVNMALAARIIAAAAYAREESRGGHFRTDFPEPQPELARRSFLTLKRADAICAGAMEHQPDRGAVLRAAFGS